MLVGEQLGEDLGVHRFHELERAGRVCQPPEDVGAGPVLPLAQDLAGRVDVADRRAAELTGLVLGLGHHRIDHLGLDRSQPGDLGGQCFDFFL